MSKLTELIRKQGLQSSQPLGFGALVGRAPAAPTLCLIGSTSADDLRSVLEPLGPGAVDAVLITSGEPSSIADSDDLEGLVWGVGPEVLGHGDPGTLVDGGCDFFIIDPNEAPASVVTFREVSTILALAEAVDRDTVAAVRALQVEGSLNTSDLLSDSLSFEDLVQIQRVAVTTGGVVLMTADSDVSTDDLHAMRESGVDGLVVPMEDPSLVTRLRENILELPAPRRPEARNLQAAAPQGRD